MVKLNKVTDEFKANQEMAKKRMAAWLEGRYIDRMPIKFTAGGKMPHSLGDMQRDVDMALDNILTRINNQMEIVPQSDYIPHLFMEYLGEGFIPSMFGAKQVISEDYPPFTKGRIINDLEKDLPKLKLDIDPINDGWGPKAFDIIDKFLDATDGQFPVAVIDHQAPYGIATKLIGNEDLMLAMYDTPDLVHELMDICTTAIETTIDVMRDYTEKKGGEFSTNSNSPMPDAGLILWDDYISVISPSLHKKFCLPYNQRLYERYGRGHLHTCGPSFPGYINAITAHNPMSIDAIILRGFSRKRKDLLKLLDICCEEGISLQGSVACYDTPDDMDEPDMEFVEKLASTQRYLWRDWSPEGYEKALEMVTEIGC